MHCIVMHVLAYESIPRGLAGPVHSIKYVCGANDYKIGNII